MNTLPALIALALLPGSLVAQSPSPASPVFILSGKREKEVPVSIASLDAQVRIAGLLAETTVTVVLRNPNSRPLEGSFSYPMPPGATLQGYALDVNGRMVDGVPVPKQKARVAFEEEQRKGIDPGLVEWSGSNRFQTRISPIPARGQRTVRLRYTSVLSTSGDGIAYRLPLNFDKVDRFKLRVETSASSRPAIRPSGLGNLSFEPWRSQFVLEREWRNLELREDLLVDIPQGGVDAPAVEQHEGLFYLAKMVTPPERPVSALPAPERVDIVWDASGSMASVDKAPIFELLKLYFASRADRPCTVRLIPVRDHMAEATEFAVIDGNAEPLLRVLKAIPYDGATADPAPALDESTPLRFLVSDGNVNFTDGQKTALKQSGVTCAIIAGLGFDRAVLNKLSTLPVDLLSQTPDQALKNIPTLKIEDILLDGKPWKDAATNAPDGIVNGPVLLTGLLPEGKHNVEIVFSSGGQPVGSVRFTADAAEAVPGTLNRSFFAQNKLAGLLLEPESAARAVLLRQLGEEYGVVTPGTSLLVLENIEQYLRHEVRPPACCPELRREYDEAIARRKTNNAQEKESDLFDQKKQALERRKELLHWYRTPYMNSTAAFTLRRIAKVFGLGGNRSGYSNVSVNAVTLPEQEAEDESVLIADGGIPPLSQEEAAVSGMRMGAGHALGAPLTAVGSASPLLGNGASSPNGSTAAPTIKVRPWSSSAPYLSALKASDDAVGAYFELRRENAQSPGFYLDCADFFDKKGDRAMAVQVLSNLIEMDLENRSLMRAAAYKLRYLGEKEKAVFLFKKVRDAFPEEPQSYRDLALALADLGQWQEAADALRQVLERPMDARFHGVEQIAAVELARIVARAQQEGKPVDTEGIDPVYLEPVEADLRVVINWDTDLSDMDLWVTGPDGEKCFFSNRLTATGGRISRDVTQGYGPEEFLIRKALPGDYKVQTHYYGSQSMKMLAPVTLYAELYTDYARPEERKKTLIFRLDGRDEIVDVAELSHDKTAGERAPRDYQVRAGDTWESIAEKELGDASEIEAIIALNPGCRSDVPPPTGRIIRLPKK